MTKNIFKEQKSVFKDPKLSFKGSKDLKISLFIYKISLIDTVI